MSALTFKAAESIWAKRPSGSWFVELCKTPTGLPVRLVKLDSYRFGVQLQSQNIIRLCLSGPKSADTQYVINSGGNSSQDTWFVINRYSPVVLDATWRFNTRGRVIRFRDFMAFNSKGELCAA